MNNQWSVSGNIYNVAEVSGLLPKLPVAVYNMVETLAGIHLEKQGDKFEFPYKVYGVETAFINRVVKTWNNISGNMGLLLNGIKGTGKTVTAQQIANALGLPVILITRDMGGLLPFINEIQQDVFLMFDEYEKSFQVERGNSTKLLTVMDGILKNGFRKFFMLTTNNPRIDENMQQRPSRVWYTKEYGNLSVEIIKEIVDDKLIHKHLRDVTIKFIASLQLITMDIVSSVIQEVNIHEEDPLLFKDIFNVKVVEPKYDIVSLELTLDGKLVKRINEPSVRLYDVKDEDSLQPDNSFYPNYVDYGTILTKQLNEEGNVILTTEVDEEKNEAGEITTKHKLWTLVLEPCYSFNGNYAGLFA